MNVISLHNVEKSYGTRMLFKDVNITFTSQSKLGLVGVNGTGKSTFLKMLAGQQEPDKGSVERNGKASIYYLPQNPTFDEDASILENIFLGTHPLMKLVRDFERESKLQGPKYMDLLDRMDREGGWDVEQEARIILNKLGFADVTLPVKQLSGGQRRRLALGQALLYPCDLLLLDEPTNHLDEASIDWLESFLQNRKGGLLMSTHERYFLDSVCNGIVELSNRRMYKYDGNYEEFLALKAQREEQEAATEEKRRQFLKREIEWVRRGAQARSTKQKARLERYEKLKNMESTRRADTMDPIALKTRLGKTIFDMEHVSFSFDDRVMVKDFTYHVVRHDRIGIVGPNGVGKSTFMKLLDGTYSPSSGTMGRGETVRIAHFTQEVPPADPDMRVLDYIKEDHQYIVLGDGSTASAGQMLERFLFTPELHGVPLRKLSGGERRRLYLLKLLMSAPNVLLLDEPTNDLDIPTLDVLEEFLDSFGGVIITVCHDRYFLDRVVDKLFVFKGNGDIEIVHGSYSDYKETVGSMAPLSGVTSVKAKKNAHAEIHKQGTPSDEGQPGTDGQSATNESKTGGPAGTTKSVAPAAPVKKGLNKAEQAEYEAILVELEQLEHLVKGLDVMIGQAGTDFDKIQELMGEKEEAQEKIETLTERWLELEEKM